MAIYLRYIIIIIVFVTCVVNNLFISFLFHIVFITLSLIFKYSNNKINLTLIIKNFKKILRLVIKLGILMTKVKTQMYWQNF